MAEEGDFPKRAPVLEVWIDAVVATVFDSSASIKFLGLERGHGT